MAIDKNDQKSKLLSSLKDLLNLVKTFLAMNQRQQNAVKPPMNEGMFHSKSSAKGELTGTTAPNAVDAKHDSDKPAGPTFHKG